MLLCYSGCSPVLWSRLWFHSYGRQVWVVVALWYTGGHSSTFVVSCYISFWPWCLACCMHQAPVGHALLEGLFLACVPWRAEMATGQSLELGWLCILAVLSPCLHFFSTMTSPFSRLLQLPHWHRDALDLLGHAQSLAFCKVLKFFACALGTTVSD